jgi:hypothetical protein
MYRLSLEDRFQAPSERYLTPPAPADPPSLDPADSRN